MSETENTKQIIPVPECQKPEYPGSDYTIHECPRPEYPRPQMVRPEWMNLNGTWYFEIDNSKSGKERKLFEGSELSCRILVPFCPESSFSGVGNKDFMSAVWYCREFELPSSWLSEKFFCISALLITQLKYG